MTNTEYRTAGGHLYRTRPIKRRKMGKVIAVVLSLLALLCIGYQDYQHRVAAGNYASKVTIVLTELDWDIMQRDIAGIKEAWGAYCLIDPVPDTEKAFQIQWKMAKLTIKAEQAVGMELSPNHTASQVETAYQDVRERIMELHAYVQEAAAYSKYKILFWR